MALLESPRPGDAREMCRTVEAGFLGRCCACQTPFPAKRCVQFAGTFGAIVPVDLRFEFVQRDEHRPALVLTLLGLASRSEEHTSELQSLMRISYAVFCLKKKKKNIKYNNSTASTHVYKTTTS